MGLFATREKVFAWDAAKNMPRSSSIVNAAYYPQDEYGEERGLYLVKDGIELSVIRQQWSPRLKRVFTRAPEPLHDFSWVHISRDKPTLVLMRREEEPVVYPLRTNADIDLAVSITKAAYAIPAAEVELAAGYTWLYDPPRPFGLSGWRFEGRNRSSSDLKLDARNAYFAFKSALTWGKRDDVTLFDYEYEADNPLHWRVTWTNYYYFPKGTTFSGVCSGQPAIVNRRESAIHLTWMPRHAEGMPPVRASSQRELVGEEVLGQVVRLSLPSQPSVDVPIDWLQGVSGTED